MKTKDFIKKILAASEDLDTLVILSAPSYESAMNLWVRDLAKSLNSILTIYGESNFKFKLTSSVYSLSEKRLEKENKEILLLITKYVDGVDLTLARKSLQYAKIAEKYLQQKSPKLVTDANISKKAKIAIEMSEYLSMLENSLTKINKFSKKLKDEINSKSLINLTKYNYQFNRIDIFCELTLDILIDRLRTNGEI